MGYFRWYVFNLGVKIEKWYFVMGLYDEIYEMVDDYFSMVKVDVEVFGGFDYSGLIIFVDVNWYVWVYCDGIDVVFVG